MKKSDIAMVVLIASVSVMISFVIANQISFLKPPQKGEDVKTIEKINPDVTAPDAKVFRADAINPTVQTVIGGGQSAQ
jgi:hypothetical protein